MNRKEALKDKDSLGLYHQILQLHNDLDAAFLNTFQRSLPLNEEIIDRWERAQNLGFGKNTSIYNSSFVFGNVKVGSDCWIGPYTVIDGSGDLEIGDHCTISVGVHIYSHDSVKHTLSSGRLPIERYNVRIGNNVYIGPNSVIVKGINIGRNCVIGAFTLVNKDIPDNSIVLGQPGVVRGRVEIRDNNVEFIYNR